MSATCLERPLEPGLASGRQDVELRLLQPGDAATLLEIFDGMSARSRELRFLTAKPRLTSTDLRALTNVDQQDHVAILAVSVPLGRPIGVARFVRDPEQRDSADVAVAVVDAWQSRGIGTMLATALVERARTLGVRRFTLVMAHGNERAARLMLRAPGELEQLPSYDDTAEFALDLGA
jgi:RimJ/RimL family protein N-acetyltransferase